MNDNDLLAEAMAWLEAEAEVSKIRLDGRASTLEFSAAVVKAADLGDAVLESLKASFMRKRKKRGQRV